MIQDIERVLLTQEEIAAKVSEIGRKISEDYRGRRLILISVLKGSVVFMADLMRAITIPCAIEFMAVSSYGSGTRSSGVVRIVKDLDRHLEGWDVLIVEDILDSGRTLAYLREYIASKGAQTIRIAAFMDKPERRCVDVYPDYCCFTVPDKFVVGYGLDYDELYRNLPYVGILKPEIYGE